MLKTPGFNALTLAAALSFAALANCPAGAAGTAFTYQGKLDDGGAPANGPHDLVFRLFDVATSGASLPSAVMSMPVSAGERFVPAAPKAVLKFPANAGLAFAEGADGRFLFIVPATSDDESSASRPQIVVVQNWVEELKRLLSSTAGWG